MRWQHQAALLRKARINKKLSQARASLLVGGRDKSSQVWSNIERCKSGLPPKHMISACEALEIPVRDMIRAMVKDYECDLLALIPEGMRHGTYTLPHMDSSEAV